MPKTIDACIQPIVNYRVCRKLQRKLYLSYTYIISDTTLYNSHRLIRINMKVLAIINKLKSDEVI